MTSSTETQRRPRRQIVTVAVGLASAIALAAIAVPTIATASTAGTAANSSATTTPAHASTNGSHPARLRVTWRMTSFIQQDTGAKGPSSGDTLQATYQLTSQTGTADYVCTLAGTTQYVCTGVVHLRGGDIYVAVAPRSDSDPAAITGGTGTYLGARGQYTQIEKTQKTGSWTFQFAH